jgi:hypothetical protein
MSRNNSNNSQTNGYETAADIVDQVINNTEGKIRQQVYTVYIYIYNISYFMIRCQWCCYLSNRISKVHEAV